MRAFLAVILAVFSCASLAADDPRQVVARRLVDLLQVDEMYQEAAKACLDFVNIAEETRKTYAANRKEYGALSPQSAYWPEVEASYRRYRAEICDGNRAQAAREIYVQVFARRLTQGQLEELVAQLDSPEGKALQAANREASTLLANYQVTEQQQAMAAAAQRYRAAIRELVARYEAQPR